MEIETRDELTAHLRAGLPLHGVRLQALDLTGMEELFRDHTDLSGLVVLGGIVPPALARMLHDRGAVQFPGMGDAPIDPWRGLYSPDELYAGLLEHGYSATPDARAYEWYMDADLRHDAYATLVRAVHDDTVSDDLDEFVEGRTCVGVMGGHALVRGSAQYADAAGLGLALADDGHLVLTGGGPGAMEAANLGAWCRSREELDHALAALATVPSFRPEITPWAVTAMRLRHELRPEHSNVRPESVATQARSVGIPTWFYGHEPPNVFCDAVAKYFSNALREEGLLARALSGIVVMPGAAGTVQEIFQAITPRYYAAEGAPVPPLVLVGRQHWTETIPVWPAVQALGRDRMLGERAVLVDDLDEALAAISDAARETPAHAAALVRRDEQHAQGRHTQQAG